MNSFSQLPTTKQVEVKNIVSTMLTNGNGFKKIRRTLHKQNICISLGTLSYWRNNATQRLRKNSFVPTASPEFAYFIGVMFGDGCASQDNKNHDYTIELGSIDKEFVEKFSLYTSKLLGKNGPYPIHLSPPNLFRTHARCKELHTFVKELKIDFNKAQPFIEAFPAEFIQGLADSEGCPAISITTRLRVGVIIAASANKDLLEFTQELLLRKFNISSKIRQTHKSGDQDSILEGRLITRTKNVYQLRVLSRNETKIFYSKINFSIIRKKEKLSDGLFIIENVSANKQVEEWKKKYVKELNGRWKRLCIMAPPPGFEPGSHP